MTVLKFNLPLIIKYSFFRVRKKIDPISIHASNITNIDSNKDIQNSH